MAVVFDDSREWRIVPIHYVKFMLKSKAIDWRTEPEGEETNIEFGTLEEGSNFVLDSVTAPDDLGGERIVAYRFTGSFIILQNNYVQLLPVLRALAMSKLNNFYVMMAPESGQPHGRQLWFSSSNAVSTVTPARLPWVHTWSTKFSIKNEKESPRLTLTVKGLMSVDFVDTNFLS